MYNQETIEAILKNQQKIIKILDRIDKRIYTLEIKAKKEKTDSYLNSMELGQYD